MIGPINLATGKLGDLAACTYKFATFISNYTTHHSPQIFFANIKLGTAPPRLNVVYFFIISTLPRKLALKEHLRISAVQVLNFTFTSKDHAHRFTCGASSLGCDLRTTSARRCKVTHHKQTPPREETNSSETGSRTRGGATMLHRRSPVSR
jgi:hypothetical protein